MSKKIPEDVMIAAAYESMTLLAETQQHKGTGNSYFNDGLKATSMFGSQPAQPVAVKVKPLVWFEVYRARVGGKYTADGYTIMWIEGVWLLSFAGESRSAWRFTDLDAAKAAAQADYEARIMAALDVQPLTVQDAARLPEIVALIDAVNGLMEVFPDPCWHDHHGKCQEHFIEDDCSVAKTIAALRAIAEGRA